MKRISLLLAALFLLTIQTAYAEIKGGSVIYQQNKNKPKPPPKTKASTKREVMTSTKAIEKTYEVKGKRPPKPSKTIILKKK